MTPFDQKKREPLLEEKGCLWSLEFKRTVVQPELLALLKDEAERPNWANYYRQLFDSRFDEVIMLYSAGEPMEEMAKRWPAVLDTFDAFLDDPHYDMNYIDLADQEVYVEMFWLLALTTLLGFDREQIRRVANFYAPDETNDGADDLFEIVCGKLGLAEDFRDDGVIHEEPYQHLLNCVQGPAEDRPAHMRAFLENWYADQAEECGWCGLHRKRPDQEFNKSGFFGYWAFEAALVTYLWDIDDTSYRDLPYYPRDLIDYARARRATAPAENTVRRCVANAPCPRAGYWYTPARAASRRFFNTGEIMPDFPASPYGTTIWSWDRDQETK